MSPYELNDIDKAFTDIAEALGTYKECVHVDDWLECVTQALEDGYSLIVAGHASNGRKRKALHAIRDKANGRYR